MTNDFNRLAQESSNYLLQHKENPVHWYAYGPEALLKAKEENKPIFLSIGYSSCHWCHVMAHESFEDQVTADFLNQNFVCIKVDREENPDIDDYYQKACQLFIKSGGWPLSAFLLPDMRPFFAGTYFPKEPREKQSSFMELLQELSRAYRDDQKAVLENAEKITEAIQKMGFSEEPVNYEGDFPHPMSILDALKEFKDDEFGGYGEPPKFPSFSFYEWAVEQMLENVIDQKEGEHVIKSLEGILSGGLYDQVRGGVHRYSTDKKWLIPHFEKMLYDQSGLLRAISKLSILYPSPLVYDAILATIEYLHKEMQSESGRFFSAQDADSEGVEGLYFSFTEEEFEESINGADNKELSLHLERLKKWFGISKEGNFEHSLNVLSLKIQGNQDIYEGENWELIRKAKKALLETRSQRIPPATDSKGVASWNFMLVTALCDVIQYTKIDIIKKQATGLLNSCLKGVFETFMIPNPEDEGKVRLRHSTTKDSSMALLEDYVFFAEMNLRVYEVSGNKNFLGNAVDTYKYIYKEFHQSGKLMTRAKKDIEQAQYPNLPHVILEQGFRSPVSTFLLFSQRLAAITQNNEMIEQLRELREIVKNESLRNPLACGEALRAMTYPLEVFRAIKVPHKWLENTEFLFFTAHLPMRFILSYYENDTTENESEKWQVCSLKECLLQGQGLNTFIEALSPPKPSAEENK